MRWFALACLLVALPLAVLAQSAGPAPALSAQQAQQALEVLRDPERRAQFIAVLEALARVGTPAAAPAGAPRPAAAPVEEVSAADSGPATGPGAAATASPAPAASTSAAPAPASSESAIPLAPDSLGAQVILRISERLASLSDDIVGAAQSIASIPLIALWVVQFASDPARQGLLLDTLWRLAVVLGAGLAAEWLVIRLLRPLGRRLADRAPGQIPPAPVDEEARQEGLVEDGAPAALAVRSADSELEQEARQSARIWRHTRRMGVWLRRVPFGLAALVLDLLPVLAVSASGYVLITGGLASQATPRLVILAALNAYVAYRVVNGVVAMLVSPAERRLRLVPVSDASAAFICRWTRRAAAVGIFGYAVVEAGLLFGLYRLAHGALIKLIMLALAGMAVVVILQQRQAVAARIRPPEAGEGMPGPGLAARARAAIAPVWHLIALVYLAALWVVLALDVPDGFSRLLRLSLSTAAVLVLARVLLILGLGGLHRLLRRADDTAKQHTGAVGRLTSYHPVLRAILRTGLGIATVLALLEVWGLPVLSWFVQSELGGRVLGTLSSIAFTLALAAGVWEAVNLAIERHLAQLAASAQAARSARLRTLLPMFRSALLVAICVVTALIVLSEIGLNIAPLLAGAGVLGVAIGFGSQRLVQDVITGLFLLLENTMQVGDVVTLGGLSGTVENLSIRTIRLRAMDGSMHIVPFSAVTTVTNMTRDFGYAVVDVSLGLSEDQDRVSDVLRDVAGTMRQEPKWAAGISGDLEVMGIDRFIDNALVLRTRMRTTPSQRWSVGRELNRRIKQRFDELGIQSPMSAARAPTPHTLEESSG